MVVGQGEFYNKTWNYGRRSLMSPLIIVTTAKNFMAYLEIMPWIEPDDGSTQKHRLTFIGIYWKTHPEFFPKFQFSGL